MTDRTADELAISRLLATYARAVDRRDWDLLRSIFHADATDQHGPYSGGVEGLVSFLEETLADVEITSHTIGQSLIEFVDEDVATSETYALAVHRERRKDGTPVDLRFGVRYLDRLERRDGGWAIADRVVVMDWSRADDVVSGSRVADLFPRGVAGPDDPSYRN